MWKDRLIKEWNENPLNVIIIGSFAATAAAKILDTMSSVRSRQAYARQINYKVKNK